MIRIAKILRTVRDSMRSHLIEKRIRTRIQNSAHVTFDAFAFENFKEQAIEFLRSNLVNGEHFLYKYSASCTKPTLMRQHML